MPRDTKRYVDIIYVTGACDFIQTACAIAYPFLMGYFYARAIAESVVWNTRIDHIING